MRSTVLLATAGLALTFAARTASAQTISIPNQSASGSIVPLERLSSSGATVTKRGGALQNVQEGISNADCLADQKIRFPLLLQAPNFGDTSLALEAWAGLNTDCTTRENRGAGGASLQRCWRLTPGQISKDLSVTVDIRVQDIVRNDVKSAGYVAATSDVCGKLDLNKFNVYFVWIRNQEAVSSVSVPFDVDMIGPPALTGVGVTPGDTRLTVGWTNIGEGGAIGNVSVRVYYADQSAVSNVDAGTTLTCDDKLVEGGAEDPDAATATDPIVEDAGCTETVNEAPTCTGQGLGDDGNTLTAPYETTSSGATRLTLEGLANYKSYAVKAVAIDEFFNVGASAEAVCGSPVELNDFFETYRNAGGSAGGGFCNVDGAGVPAGTAGLFVCAGAGFLAMVRRVVSKKRATKRDDAGASR